MLNIMIRIMATIMVTIMFDNGQNYGYDFDTIK